MDNHVELVQYLLGDKGDEKFPRMATHSLLSGDGDVIPAAGLPELIDQLSRFIPEEDVEPAHLQRITHANAMLRRLWSHGGMHVDHGEVSLGRAVAILWSGEYDLLLPLASSSNEMDRVLFALADIPGTDAQALWADSDDLVRVAYLYGHGAMCPVWQPDAMDEDPSEYVRFAIKDIYDSYRYDEPGSEYQCNCPRKRDSALSSDAPTESLGGTAVAGEDVNARIKDRFRGLAEVIRWHKTFVAVDHSPVAEKMLALTAISAAARELREDCRRDGLPVDAYSDEMVNYSLGELIMGSFGERDRARMDGHSVSQGVALARNVVWLIEDSLRHDGGGGDWAKRLSGALSTLGWLHAEIRKEIDALIRHSDVTWAEWMIPEYDDDDLSSDLSLMIGDSSEFTSEVPTCEGVGILNFHQAMWLVEGDCPLELPIERDENLPPQDRNWGDQPNFEEYLPQAWHARRTDDWSFFVPLVERLAGEQPEARFSAGHLALYNALNHLLLYAGDGQHPLGAIGELLSSDDDQELLGGFTYAFKECWRPLLVDMWHWWSGSAFAPDERAGLPREWVNKDLGPLGDVQGRVDTADPMHLSTHCGAPLGQDWDEQHRFSTGDASTLRNEPTVVTVTVPTYRHWMAVLRTMETAGPTIVKVMISEDEPPFGVTLGFWLVQKLDEPHPVWRNHVRFLTDSAAPTVLSLVRDWKWQLPENEDDSDD